MINVSLSVNQSSEKLEQKHHDFSSEISKTESQGQQQDPRVTPLIILASL